MINRRGLFFLAAWIIAFLLIAWVTSGRSAQARDDGRYANNPLKPWFDQLASKKGLCCSFADGIKVENPDWDIRDDGHYAVRLEDGWHIVPDEAVITEKNRFGAAVVWPYRDADGVTQIRCFMPGAGA